MRKRFLRKFTVVAIVFCMLFNQLTVLNVFATGNEKHISIRVEGFHDTLISTDSTYTTQKTTVFDALSELLQSNSIPIVAQDSQYGKFVSSINNESAGTFGGYDGWMYLINGVDSGSSIDACNISDGDSIIVYYGGFDPQTYNPKVKIESVSTSNMKITLTSNYFDWNINQNVDVNISGASVKLSGNTYTTDSNGQVVIPKPQTDGIYSIEISENRDNNYPLIIRTVRTITIKNGEIIYVSDFPSDKIGTNPTLSGLSVNADLIGCPLSPTFSSNKNSYAVQIPSETKVVTLYPKLTLKSSEIIEVNGGTKNQDGSITVPVNSQSAVSVDFTVQAEDKLHSMKYTVNITKTSSTEIPVTDDSVGWTQFRGDSRLPGIIDGKTPTNSSEASLLWSDNLNSGVQNPMPITIGNYIYMTAKTIDNKWVIQKRNITNGNVVKQTELYSECGYFSFLSYGEGKLFVPIENGSIQAFDINALQSLWISKPVDSLTQFNAQTISPILYHDGYIYTGLTNGNAKDGMYICISAKDEDTSKSNEIKEYQWTYTPPAKFVDQEGYYWSGGAIVGDKIIFVGEAGEIVSHDLTTNAVYDKFECGEAVRSTIQYDKATKSIIFTTKSGYIHKLTVNTDGTFDDNSYKSIKLSDDITSSPVTYNGRIYVGNGTGGGNKFSILDAQTLDIIYQIDINTQSSPIISTAYATAENNYLVKIYIAKFGATDELFCISDFEGNTTPSFTSLALPTPNNYNTCTLTSDINGTLYYKNDTGRIFAYGNTNSAYTANDVTNAIRNLPSKNALTLDDEVLVQRAKFRYNSLSSEEKASVSNSDKNTLTALESKLVSLKDINAIKAKLIADIEVLPMVITLSDRDKIDGLISIYNSLSQSEQADITNYSKLESAKNALKILIDNKTVSDLITQIDDLSNTVSYDSKNAIYVVFDRYDTLNSELKLNVTNSERLITIKNQVDTIISEINSLNNAIWNDIHPTNITLKDRAKVNELISRYNNLSNSDKAHIKNYDDVLYAKKVIDGLEKGNVIPDVFENIMGNPDADYKVDGKTPDGKKYTFTFNGNDITEPMGFDTQISFTSSNEKKIKEIDKNAIVISFSHHGNLPGKATVEIQVDLADGIYPLYYFNEETQKAEFIQNVTIKDGIASFEITHCSDYFLSAKVINPRTEERSPSTVYFIAISIGLIAVSVVWKSKKIHTSNK